VNRLALIKLELSRNSDTAILVKKSQNFPIAPVFLPPPPKKWFPLELGTGAEDQKCEWWGNLAEKKFDNKFHLRDRQTDKWTRDDSEDCAYV